MGGGSNELEVLHGWTGDDGAQAEEALVEAFQEEQPDVETNFSPIGGGGNQNLDTVVARFPEEAVHLFGAATGEALKNRTLEDAPATEPRI